jgi:hypothetical protein
MQDRVVLRGILKFRLFPKAEKVWIRRASRGDSILSRCFPTFASWDYNFTTFSYQMRISETPNKRFPTFAVHSVALPFVFQVKPGDHLGIHAAPKSYINLAYKFFAPNTGWECFGSKALTNDDLLEANGNRVTESVPLENGRKETLGVYVLKNVRNQGELSTCSGDIRNTQAGSWKARLVAPGRWTSRAILVTSC